MIDNNMEDNETMIGRLKMLQRENVAPVKFLYLQSHLYPSIIYIDCGYDCPLLKDPSVFLIAGGNPVFLALQTRCLALWFQFSFHISSFPIKDTGDYRLFLVWVFVCIPLSLPETPFLPSFMWKIITHPSTPGSNVTLFF